MIQLLPLIVVAIVLIVPTIRVLARTGKSRWWALVALFPVFGIVVLVWVLAHSRWPAQRDVAGIFD